MTAKYRSVKLEMTCPKCGHVEVLVSHVVVSGESMDVVPCFCPNCNHEWGVTIDAPEQGRNYGNPKEN